MADKMAPNEIKDLLLDTIESMPDSKRSDFIVEFVTELKYYVMNGKRMPKKVTKKKSSSKGTTSKTSKTTSRKVVTK